MASVAVAQDEGFEAELSDTTVLDDTTVVDDAGVPEDATVLDDIIVQGTKLQQAYVDTAESVGVLDGNQIEEQGLTDLRDAYSLFGNVRYLEGGSGNAGFVIRGLSAEGVTESLNTAPLTSMIIDGTTQTIETMRRGARGLWDVEQVEIFRGPQSTLQGRGALAGAVIVETRDPTFHFEGDFRAIAGTQDRRELAFALSGPIVDGVLAARISGEYRERERGIDYAFSGFDEVGEDKYRNLRAKLLFLPPDLPGLSLKLTYSDTYDRPGQSVAGGTDFFDRKFNADSDYPLEIREADNRNVAFEASYDFGGDMQLTSISSWLDSKIHIYAPDDIAYFRDADWTDDNFTQDLRLVFGSAETNFSGVVGLYYGHFTQAREDLMTYTYPGPSVVEIQNFTRDSETTHISAYADLNWRFAPSWTVNVGGRLLREDVSDDIQGEIFQTPASLSDETSDTVFLPKAGITYAFSPDQTLAFTVQRGYRSGFVALQDGAGPTRVKPEFMTDYEIVYRIQDPDGYWRFGASLFYSQYTDQQVVVARPLPLLPQTQNAGKSEMYGAEFEGQYSFGNGLSIFGSVGLLHTEFLKFTEAAYGNEFPESPRLTAGLGVYYEHESGFFGSLNGSYTSSFYSTGSIENEPTLEVEGFTVFNMELGKRFDNGAEIAIYADNLFDNDYVLSLSGGPPPTEASVSEPRTIGLVLRKAF
ncbi:TonB-dependent receptor [Tropicimonas sp.]|uniref:TonB-dependent receptor n=1 Tax=Tropicimonas sp. TaxID=2067044 RepID=UPI003A8629D0